MEMDSIVQVTMIKPLFKIFYYLLLNIVPDPCLMNPCDVNADCTREGLLSPNFTCTCKEPYTDGNGSNCSSKDNKTAIYDQIFELTKNCWYFATKPYVILKEEKGEIVSYEYMKVTE